MIHLSHVRLNIVSAFMTNVHATHIHVVYLYKCVWTTWFASSHHATRNIARILLLFVDEMPIFAHDDCVCVFVCVCVFDAQYASVLMHVPQRTLVHATLA